MGCHDDSFDLGAVYETARMTFLEILGTTFQAQGRTEHIIPQDCGRPLELEIQVWMYRLLLGFAALILHICTAYLSWVYRKRLAYPIWALSASCVP